MSDIDRSTDTRLPWTSRQVRAVWPSRSKPMVDRHSHQLLPTATDFREWRPVITSPLTSHAARLLGDDDSVQRAKILRQSSRIVRVEARAPQRAARLEEVAVPGPVVRRVA